MKTSLRAHLGAATDAVRGRFVAPTGPDSESGFRRMVFGRWADCQLIANPRHPDASRRVGTSLHYGVSARMHPNIEWKPAIRRPIRAGLAAFAALTLCGRNRGAAMLYVKTTCNDAHGASAMPASDLREEFGACLSPARRIHCYRLADSLCRFVEQSPLPSSWQYSASRPISATESFTPGGTCARRTGHGTPVN